MMPDGMVVVQDANEVRGQWAAFGAMHERLVKWGKVLLQGAKGDEPNARPEETIRKAVWTAIEEGKAWTVDRLVNQLEPKQRIVLRVWYKAREADYWYSLYPDEQRDIEVAICREINARMCGYCAEVRQLPVTVRPYQLPGIREAAIRMMLTMQ